MERKLEEGVLLGPILRMAWWRHIIKQGKYWRGPKEPEKNYDLRKRTTIYKVWDVVLNKNNPGVLGSSKKLNPVWKGIWVVNKIMSAVLLEIKNNEKVCIVHHDTLKKCGDIDLPR